MELSFTNGLLDFIREDKGGFVLYRNDHPLGSCKATGGAGVEEALYLLVYPANRLKLAHLVYTSCHGNILPYRETSYGRQKGIEFR